MDAESSSSYGDIIVNCPETVEGTAFYKSLLPYAPPDTLQYTWDEHLAAMQSGNIAMAIMWSDTIPSLEDQSSSAIAGRVGYASLPALSGSEPKTQIAGWSYLISNSSNQKEEALRFVIWMMGAEQQIAQQLLGGASALKETYNNSEVLKIPYTSGYISAIEDAVTMSSSFPEMEAISNELQICISDYLSGDESAKSALDRCALRINEVLRARGDVVLQCPVTSRN